MPPSTKKIRIFSFSWRDLAIFCALFGSAVLLCILLHMASSSEGFAYSIFILTVLLISRFTTGYLFGTLAAVLSVVGTNYIFTYPYWAVNFTLSGYPLTFLTMLVVSLVTCTMTTKIKRQEALRIEAAREKMRANLLRSVSHDIRTPLTSIIGSTSAMIENPDLPEGDRLLLLTDVRDDAQWLIRVVENLLSITRMGDTTTRLVKNPEPAEEILGAVTAKFRKRYPDVRIRVSVPEDLLFVPMDAVLISQVLSNLLENACPCGERGRRPCSPSRTTATASSIRFCRICSTARSPQRQETWRTAARETWDSAFRSARRSSTPTAAVSRRII